MKLKVGYVGLLLICFTFNAVAQRSNIREKWVSVFDQPVMLDTLTIVPGSINCTDPGVRVAIDHHTDEGLVTLRPDKPLDSLLVTYKVFPYAFHNKAFHKSQDLYDSGAYFKTTAGSRLQLLNDRREELFATPNLYKSGVISRGITFGNRQDIFVNSVLNLQMDGKLSERLNIRASITDQNVPYQPEGNTRLVQDFDNVFIELYNDAFSLTGGDIVLENTTSNFLRYYRNVQGARVYGKYSAGGKMDMESELAVSVSKGRFSSYRLEVIDGISGPYKVYGPDNEKFIIIQANSERVYLDGQLLERGFNNHYVIDYNTAEITFTNKVVITKFSRIQVDFEYSNQAYSRTAIAAAQRQSFKNFELSVNYYQEKDNPGQPLTFELSDVERQLLSMAGPGQTTAYIPGWDSVGYSQERILYARRDTITRDGTKASVFIHSDHPDSAQYQVFFTEVGTGAGDYIRKSSEINGKVYEWISPVDGIARGNFMPVRVIPLPNKKQMITVQSALHIDPNQLVFSELAFSTHDDNLYNKDTKGMNGMALKTGYRAKGIRVGFLPGYEFSGQVDYEYTSQDFRAIDRFRPVEFNRDWSYFPGSGSKVSSDHILNARAGIRKDNMNFFNVRAARRLKAGNVDGWQTAGEGMYDMRWLHIQSSLFYLNNDNGLNHSRWVRYRATTYFKSRYLYPGYEYRLDRNQMTPSYSDSIIYSADNFEEHRFFIRNSDSLGTLFNINYTIRKDRLPEYGEMVDRNIARTGNVMVGTQKGKLGKLDVNVTYRELDYKGGNDISDLRSLMGRMDWSAHLFRKHVRTDLMYAIGNGRELKREYVYIPVPTGQGTHTWRDDNQDGKQDLGEFYLAMNNDERNFIKLFTPTDDYVLAYDNQLSYRISADMPRSWKHSTGIKKFLGRFSNNLNLSLQQKTAVDRFIDNLFFNQRAKGNQELLSYRDQIRNNLYFNRADPRYGFELSYNRLSNKQLLAQGFEARNSTSMRGMSRVNIERDFMIRVTAGMTDLENSSDYLPGRNYFIRSKLLNTSFEWQPGNNFRISTDYSHSRNRNYESMEPEGEYSVINEGVLSMKFARASSKNIDFTLRYAHIDFFGEENTAVGYELLKALQPGGNLTWTLNWQQKLFNGLQVNFYYEGRKSGDLSVSHIGRMQVMAMF